MELHRIPKTIRSLSLSAGSGGLFNSNLIAEDVEAGVGISLEGVGASLAGLSQLTALSILKAGPSARTY